MLIFVLIIISNRFVFRLLADESGCESDMAEGVEEAESNSGGDATAMLGAAMPCETMSPNIGSLKREFEAYHSSIAPSSAPTTPVPQGQPINLKSEVSGIFIIINSFSIEFYYYYYARLVDFSIYYKYFKLAQ